jgi:hypothetical protein
LLCLFSVQACIEKKEKEKEKENLLDIRSGPQPHCSL